MFRRIISAATNRSKSHQPFTSSSSSSSTSYLPTHHKKTNNDNNNENTTTTTTIPLSSSSNTTTEQQRKGSGKNNNKPSSLTYKLLVATFLIYSIGVGYYISTRPKGKWRSPFSYHPFLMTIGFVGMMGLSAVTKKLGGYTNTKLHGMAASFGFFCSLGGLYAIYHNKNLMQRPHFTSIHGKIGIGLVISTLGPLSAGVLFLVSHVEIVCLF